MLLAAVLALRPAPAQAAEPSTRISVLGSLAGLRLFEQFEARFWREQVPRLTGGRLEASATPFDVTGIRGQDMLHLIRLGVVPFGTVLVSLAANDEPELAAPNLAMLAPDIGSMRRVMQSYRPRLASILKEHYGAELLAVYAYPAQVLFCTTPLPNLEAVRGRRVRTGDYSQADAVAALGGLPTVLPFGALRGALEQRGIDCLITGSLSGNQAGLHPMLAQVHGMPIAWGLSIFAANQDAWAALPAEQRTALRRGLAVLEQEVWTAAGQDTEDGFHCNAGWPDCRSGSPGALIWQQPGPEDETVRRRLLAEQVLPGWVARCGEECRTAWNTYLAPMTRIFLPAADGALPPAAQPGAGTPGAGPLVPAGPFPAAQAWGVQGAGMPGAGSQAMTGGLPASITAPAASSTSSR